MTVESNYAIVIATFSDWLKNLAPAFQPMRSKSKYWANLTRNSPNEALRKISNMYNTVLTATDFIYLFFCIPHNVKVSLIS